MLWSSRTFERADTLLEGEVALLRAWDEDCCGDEAGETDNEARAAGAATDIGREPTKH